MKDGRTHIFITKERMTPDFRIVSTFGELLVVEIFNVGKQLRKTISDITLSYCILESRGIYIEDLQGADLSLLANENINSP